MYVYFMFIVYRVFVEFWVMVFNNILAISWRFVLLVVETGVQGENYRSVASQ